MREVASYLKVAPPTATALIQSFVEDGILDRSTDPEDRRRVRLSLSKKGLRIMEEMKGRKKATFQRIFSSLSDEDCRELSRILTIITRS
jgi:DNA-binding MarR family transcriptional regulator